MLRQLFNIERTKHFLLACSGGVDSMAIADFYKKGNKNFTIAYFNHGTAQASKMHDFTKAWAVKNSISFVTGEFSRDKKKEESWEEFWRNERYDWLKSFKRPIVTCHHLDDVVETWIFSSLHGNPKVIAPINDQVLRPFMLNTKAQLKDWCVNNKVEWLEDLSNQDTHYPRNRIRHNIVPEAMLINPGLHKVMRKKILALYESNETV